MSLCEEVTQDDVVCKRPPCQCRELVVPAEFFTHGVFMLILLVHPCLFASRALELVSAQFLPLILM